MERAVNRFRVNVTSGAENALGQRSAWWKNGTGVVVWIAVGTVAAHVATGGQYGFDRDELMALGDARHLAWGYVTYPPMTPFFARMALVLFGTSLVGFRFFAAVAQAVALILTGLMTKKLGGGKWAQLVATLAGVPFCLGGGALMQYVSFDYVCWVLVAYAMLSLLNSEDARCCLGLGAGIGLGMMAKYTMGFLAMGVVAGVLLTRERRHLRSGWLWCGVLLAVAIFLPNFLWQSQRNFISLEFLKSIHKRDVQAGVTDWFLLGQAKMTLLALPLAMAGIYFYLFTKKGKRYRALGWMYAVPLALFLLMRGRDYYLAPAYPMLYAAGAVWGEQWLATLQGESARRVRAVTWVALVADVTIAAAVALPIAPVNSTWWKMAAKVDITFSDEIGWPEFVQTVAQVRDQLPAEERARAGILAGNYGEVDALNLYGEKYGLPRAISGVNSSWERGYGDAAQTVIVAGYSREALEKHFASCQVAAHSWNQYGVANEETTEHPDIFVCRGLQESWAEFWKGMRKFA
jgi:4-amino-4-deoxy-L-arabinose transferase-like glycosyltransferase